MPRTVLLYRLIMAPVKDFPAGVDFVEARHRHGWGGWDAFFGLGAHPGRKGDGGIFKPRRQRAITTYR
jgi:hypothetical protein